MEIEKEVDITDQFDLGSIERGENITVALDLEDLIRDLLKDVTPEKSP